MLLVIFLFMFHTSKILSKDNNWSLYLLLFIYLQTLNNLPDENYLPAKKNYVRN